MPEPITIPQQLIDDVATPLERPTVRHSDDEFQNYAYNEGIDAGLSKGGPAIVEWAIGQEHKRILDAFKQKALNADPILEEHYRTVHNEIARHLGLPEWKVDY